MPNHKKNQVQVIGSFYFHFPVNKFQREKFGVTFGLIKTEGSTQY